MIKKAKKSNVAGKSFLSIHNSLCIFMVKIRRLATFEFNTLETLSNLMQAKSLVIPLFLCFFFSAALSNAQDRLVRIVAKNGDSAEGLMQRYRLSENTCNLDHFFKVNNLESNAGLKIGKKYYLPILIYDYNGESIRTSLNLEGWEKPYEIKKYNELLKNKKLRTSSIVSSNIIWVPYDVMGCGNKKTDANEAITQSPTSSDKIVELAPITPGKEPEKTKTPFKQNSAEALLAAQNRSAGYRRFPIFGKKYEHVPLIDSKLKGKVYYIVSGHGGPDPGALGNSKNKRLCEDEYAYDVGLRLCRNLLEHGATVYMIIRDPDDGMRDDLYLDCDRDEYCWGNKTIPLNQKKRLAQRANAVNELYRANRAKGIKDQTLITIHIDSRSKGTRTDVFFYHYPKSHSSKKLAQRLHQTFKEKYAKYRSGGQYHGTVSSRDLYMLRYTDPRAVFIELGNIRNSADQKRFLYETNRDALAKWLYEGLIR